MSWLGRLKRLIEMSAVPVIMQGGPEWGSHRIVASLRRVEQPLVWVDFGQSEGSDDRAIGNLLSDAVRDGLGAPLFGRGVETSYAIAVMERYLGVLQPLTLAITGADVVPQCVDRLVETFRSPNTVVIQAHDIGVFGDWLDRAQVLGPNQLRMRLEEAIEAFGADTPRPEIANAVAWASGAIGLVEQKMGLPTRTAPKPLRPTDSVEMSATNSGAAIDALILRNRWFEAFEVAVAELPSRILETIDEAGHSAFDRGEFDRFWRSVSTIRRSDQRHDAVQYWRFSAAVAVNKWRAILGEIDDYLDSNEAPDLRALRSTVDVTPTSLKAAERAFDRRKSVGTLSALGFLYSLNSVSDRAVPLLKQAIEMAEREGRQRLAILAASNLVLAYMSDGRYIRVRYWASWALRQLVAHGIQDELLRLSVTNMAAYASLLTDSVVAAEQALATVAVDDRLLGIPSMEGIVSTLGDLEIVRGRPREALEHYSRLVTKSERRQLPIAANDLVRAYIMGGDIQAAIDIASEAYEVGSSASGFEQHVGKLALGTALMESNDDRSEVLLSDALTHFLEFPFSTYCAQASIQLARLMLIRGRMAEAKSVLVRASDFLDELGGSGWALLGGGRPEIAMLRAMFRTSDPEVQLQLLGNRSVCGVNGIVQMSLRSAELIAVLAHRPSGVRSEELAVALYGDAANVGTLKAAVSRARRYIKIDGGPYRIGSSFRADHVEVLDLLRNNRVQGALELYRGPLLPESQAPAIVELREHLEEAMRQAVLSSEDPDTIIDFANQQGNDLELWEEARRSTSPNDPRRPLVNARIRRILRNW